jgi:hypothetical protein
MKLVDATHNTGTEETTTRLRGIMYFYLSYIIPIMELKTQP